MRFSLTALLTLLLIAACSQAPVRPAPAQTPPADEASPYPIPPPSTTPPPQVQPAAPAAPAALPQPQEVPVDKDHREVLIHTNYGDITVQLDAAQAPVTAKHFLAYVTEHYFDGSAFYRVMPGFVIQGGDFTADLDYHTPTHKALRFESSSLTNQRGSIAMAHFTDPNSGNAAFFINLADNTPQFTGSNSYAVFGQVVAGMDVVDKIAAVDTHTVNFVDPNATPFEDVPVKPVKILKVTLLPLPVPGKH
jgi:peptidyl-prolyl cis-trans isomerase A (cyclophilin A)